MAWTELTFCWALPVKVPPDSTNVNGPHGPTWLSTCLVAVRPAGLAVLTNVQVTVAPGAGTIVAVLPANDPPVVHDELGLSVQPKVEPSVTV